MILSDEEIKESHAPYPVFRDSHLEANTELRKARERIRELENENEGLRNCQEALYNELFPEEQEDEREVRWKWMTLRVEEMRDRISFLEDISSREFWAASRKIAEFQGRADRTEAKLRELVEAAEAKDRIENLKEPDYFPNPEKRYAFQDTKSQILERYQITLKAAKEE